MNKRAVDDLWTRAKDVAVKLSSNMTMNPNGEIYTVSEIRNLSERSAAVIYERDSGLFSISFFVWIRNDYSGNGFWLNVFIAESHLVGMRQLPEIFDEIEEKNFALNSLGKKDG
jgi:hypothetical protein